MKLCRVATCLFSVLSILPASAQDRENYRGLLTQQVASDKLSGPQHLRDYVADGKLRLGLRDAVLLTLENNSAVRVQEARVETSKFALLGTYQPFDPKLESVLDVSRFSSPGTNELQGIGTSGNGPLNLLNQNVQVNYSQTFQTGTNLVVGLASAKTSTNSSFYFFNPYFSSTLKLQFTQPLLRNAWRFANRTPLVIARRALQQSRASFEAQVSDAILQVVTQYWAVVQARGDLEVERKSLEAADVTYQNNKRALELGALPPLDIYRSESAVASRRVLMIKGEYALKRTEDALRMTIGADLDPYFHALDLELTEKPDVEGEPRNMDAASALGEALKQRPDLLAARYSLDNDDTSIRLARNRLKPDLSLSGFYQSNGLGGNEFSLATGQLISRGGLGSSFNQLFGFGFPGYGATLTLNLPIKNRAAQAELGSALVSRHRDLYLAQEIQQQVTLDVTNSIHQLEEAKLTLAAGRTALDLAQKVLAAEHRKYELGVGTIFFILDAQTQLAQAQSDLLQAEISYQVAVAAVDHATGGLLQPYHVQVAELSQ
jgi:HAE1 family hydrophobic/amphiphilic exporter-1